MIDNPEDVQLVKDALQQLHDLKINMEKNDDWDGYYGDFIEYAGNSLKKLIYKWNEETHQYDGDPNPWKEDYDDDD